MCLQNSPPPSVFPVLIGVGCVAAFSTMLPPTRRRRILGLCLPAAAASAAVHTKIQQTKIAVTKI